MYLRVYDPENKKYCVVEVKSFVGDLPENFGLCEVIDEYASEKLIEDKKKILAGDELDFTAKAALNIKNKSFIFTIEKEYESLKLENEELKKKISKNNKNEDLMEQLEKCRKSNEYWKKSTEEYIDKFTGANNKVGELMTELELLKSKLNNKNCERKIQKAEKIINLLISEILGGDE